MSNSPGTKTILMCEHCGNATFCAFLNPKECNQYIPEINSNFNVEIKIDPEYHTVLSEV
jgi:hypothetical protein